MTFSTSDLALARQYLADVGTSAVQQITIENAISGTFTISYAGQTTSALAFNAGGNVVQNALCALSNVGVGNITVIENQSVPGSLVYVVYFTASLGNVAQVMLTVDSTLLVGVGVLVTVEQTVAGGTVAFTDAELNALNTQASLNFFLTIAYGFRQLMANAAKFNNYTAGQTKEEKAQIFDHLKVLADFYQEWAFAGEQFMFASMIPEPPRLKAVPWAVGAPATSIQYAPPYGTRWWGWRGSGW